MPFQYYNHYYGYYYAEYYADLFSGRTWRKVQEKDIFYEKLMKPQNSVLDPFKPVASASSSSSSSDEDETESEETSSEGSGTNR